MLRQAALLALATLDSEHTDEHLWHGLRDVMPSVAHACARQFLPHGVVARRGELLDLARNATAPHQHRIVLWLARRLGRWDWLILLLDMVAVLPPDQTASTLAAELSQWDLDYDRDNSQLTPHQASLVEQSMRQGNALLNARQRELIEFSISLQKGS